MTTINKLTRVDRVQAGGVLPVYVQNQGDARGASMTVIMDYVKENLTTINDNLPTYTTAFQVADDDKFIIVNGTGSVLVILPSPSESQGRELVLKNVAAFTVVASLPIVVPLAGGAPGTAILPAVAGSWVTLVSDGINWHIMQA